MEKKFNYITEVLTKADLKVMLDNREGFTLIVSPTGTGKSTFIIEDIIKPHFKNENHGFGQGIYQDFASKKILVMANRTAVVLKFNDDVEKACEEMGIYKAKNITVASYQKVSQVAHDEMLLEIEEAEIILCDEAHYFIADAWNGTTGAIMNKILEASEQKPVIFFTATPQQIIKYFNNRGLTYKELDYRNVLGFNDRMDFVCTNKDLEQIIKSIDKNEKIMVFVADMTSRKMIARMCQKYVKKGYQVEFYHSVWVKPDDGRFNGLKIPQMAAKVGQLVSDKKFDTQIAIANKAIDNGIDIIDPDFKHIILLNQYDQVQIQQMVGRKRFDIHNPNDRLTVWLSTENQPMLENFYDLIIAQINFIKKFRQYRSENIESAKSGMKILPGNKNKSEGEILKLAESWVVDSFFAEDVNIEESENLKVEKRLIQSEEYAKLLSYQLDYISPLVCKHLMDTEEALTTDELQSIVKNYQKLVKELFERPATLQWRNKYIASEENKLEFKQRIKDELIPYLNELEGIKLFDNEKRAFEEKISHYFGASKRIGRLASLKTINEFIQPHGFEINAKRPIINNEKKTVWIVEELMTQDRK
ncbi:DEAD/DEAH box helicase family protein [Cytobacillus sp. Sa5YUA1]|uniref:DEAD/DEAH box helicase family protein n=1 Tax=Cytobacillus stercorigallinarum TaxID=2762240 RepID=A0ABR8QNC9_9BACI|nr:DEAD/DEAH box helicase family protein [Cytobacillus stercorigallinarum]MBD7937029.1 DEAD/DEAH box helicase family protein [Cytobacillus stercorigallinarum]